MRYATRLAAAVTLLTLAAAPMAAQPLADRVGAVRDGMVRMTFPTRPDVCSDGRGSVWIQDANRRGFSIYESSVCVRGPVVVRIGRADNQTVSVRTWIGERGSMSQSDVDLGIVPAPEAARLLMSLSHAIGGNSADEAITAAAFADGIDLSREFRDLARDDNAPLESRRQSLFWYGQSDAPTRELVGLYDNLQAFTLREHFTFVLSQRHDDEAIDKLIAVARSDRDTEIRKRAMFWLGQSHDPKALKFLRDLITR